MLVVEIRIVGMRVPQWRMPVRVCVRFARRVISRVCMLMMFVVDVEMLVLLRFVVVLVGVVLRQV